MSDTEPMRSEGPAVTVHGRGGERRVLVLDPAGASKHDELPATWRPLTERTEVIWVRLPASGDVDCDRFLSAPESACPRTDVVTSGPYGEFAIDLARRHPSAVRSVLLVDPAADSATDSDHAAQADEVWFRRHGTEIAEAREAGITVDVVAHSTDDDQDRVPPPLPLGHPRVVDSVRRALDHLPGVRTV
ncbi:hypothetical protein [Prauserella rugosa]|nr:hypothetical protein [Prauserella rugosa]KMS83052.1 hypothetical protein ACZ91_55225 [Streptomyces regensis]